MPKGICSVDGCDREHYARDLCAAHYRRWLKDGEVGPAVVAARRALGRKCSVTDCDQPSTAHGFCNGHYKRWQASGDPHADKPLAQRQEGACSIEGCDRDAVSRGMCARHVARWYRYGDPLAGDRVREAQKGRACSVDGCGRAAKSLGWCAAHYGRYLKHGSVEADRPILINVAYECIAPGCTATAKGKGYCGMHYARWRRYGDPLAVVRTHHDQRSEPEGHRWCPLCERSLSLDDFPKKRRNRDGRGAWCRRCTSEHRIARQFGLSPEQFAERLAAQGGVCAICGRPETALLRGILRRITVDHDHGCCPGAKSCGKCVRDLLCNRCNRVLGLIEDEPELANAMAAYLRSWSGLAPKLGQELGGSGLAPSAALR